MGFDASDISATNGVLSSFTGIGASYSAISFTANLGLDHGSTGSATVANSSYTDVALNPGTGNSATVAIDTVAPTMTVTFVQNAGRLLSSQSREHLQHRVTCVQQGVRRLTGVIPQETPGGPLI